VSGAGEVSPSPGSTRTAGFAVLGWKPRLLAGVEVAHHTAPNLLSALVPEGRASLAHRFSGGKVGRIDQVPEGLLQSYLFCHLHWQKSLFLNSFALFPI